MNTINQDKLSPMLGKYLKAYEANPSGRTFLPLAEAYRKIGENKKAMEILVKGIKLHPTYHTAYISLAQCYFESKSFELAYSTLRPFVHMHKDNIKVQRLYGDICLQVNYKEEALEAYKILLFLNPKDKEIAKLVAQMEMGTSFINDNLNLNKSEIRAIPEISNHDNTSESTVDDWIRLDIVTPESGNKNEEWQVLKSSGPINVQNDHSNISLDFESFEETTNTEVEFKDDGPPFITHTLIDLYEGQGHLDKAIEVLEKIIQIKPDDKKSHERLELLKSKWQSSRLDNRKDEAELGRTRLMELFDEKVGAQSKVKYDQESLKVNMEKFGEKLLLKLAQRARESSKLNANLE